VTTLRLDPYQELKGAPKQPRGGGPTWYVDPDKANEDLDIERMVLDVVHNTKTIKDLRIDEIIVDGEIERTMDGASTFTLTLHDPYFEILRSPALQRAIDVQLDNLWFRLVSIEKQGTSLLLTFEDRLVAWLRAHNKIERMSRNKMTRLEFCLWLVRHVRDEKIPCVVPELHKKFKIEKLSAPDTRAVHGDVTHAGLNNSDEIKVKGKQATNKQVTILENLLDVGEKMDVPRKFLLAIVMVAIQESEVGKYRWHLNADGSPNKSNPYQGVLHQDTRENSYWRKNGGGNSSMTTRAVRGQAKAFFTRCREIYADNHDITSEALAEKVQVAGTPSAWGKWKEEATDIVNAWGGRTGNPLEGEDATGVVTRTYRKRYLFTTEEGNKVGGKKQNYWDAIKGLCAETNLACFVSNGVLYMISEGQLINGKVRMILGPNTMGVTDIDFTLDTGQKEATATVTCRAARWIAPPGTCIKLVGMGRANGRWLVESIRRNVYSRDASITLKKADHILPEPAPETGTITVGGDPGEGPQVKGLSQSASAAYKAAQRITRHKYPYVWGGGHAKAGTPDGGTGRDSGKGFDCSGAVAAVLVAGGWYDEGASVGRSDKLPIDAGLKSGVGKYITVWANAGHTFIEFTFKGDDDSEDKTVHFGTGNWGANNYKKGAAIQKRLHPHGGYKPYHPAGETAGPRPEPKKKSGIHEEAIIKHENPEHVFGPLSDNANLLQP
jgi:hypothetical protein